MSDDGDWIGVNWSEEEELAVLERSARRILSCPKALCRRVRGCRRGPTEACGGQISDPTSEAEFRAYQHVENFKFGRIYAEHSLEPAVAAGRPSRTRSQGQTAAGDRLAAREGGIEG